MRRARTKKAASVEIADHADDVSNSTDAVPLPSPVTPAPPSAEVTKYTRGQLREAVNAVLNTVVFSPPISLTYCEAVCSALVEQLPEAQIDVYSRRQQLVVIAKSGDSKYVLEIET